MQIIRDFNHLIWGKGKKEEELSTCVLPTNMLNDPQDNASPLGPVLLAIDSFFNKLLLMVAR